MTSSCRTGLPGPATSACRGGAVLGRCRSGGYAVHGPAPAAAGWVLPGPGWPWVLAAVTCAWQCGQVSAGAVMVPQVSWMSRTGGPPGVGAHWSPQAISAVVTGKRARPFADVRQMERVVKDSDLDWTLVRPTRLVSDPGKGEYRVRADFPPPGGGKIARADVAHFIGAALTSASYIRESPTLAY